VLQIDSLTRRFGQVMALDDVGFDVRPGRMTGFVGANGAGKTTTMRIVLGVLAATSGEVRWNGAPVTAADRRRFGYMPEERGLYPKQAVAEQLVFFARLHGLGRAAAASRVDELLERLGLSDRRGDRLDTLSLGNQQRVQVAAALVHGPSALVLDEPFSGLDPLAVDAMAELLREEVARDVPVLFSSHQLDLVDRLCDDVVVLAGGRVVAAGATESLRRASGELLRLQMADDSDAGWVRELDGLAVRDVDGPVALVEVLQPGAEQALLADALGRGPVHEMARLTPSLSEIFRETAR
jgi:ABC-2 type transport system ATP-binding protein